MSRLTVWTGFLALLMCAFPLLAAWTSPAGQKARLKAVIVKNDSRGRNTWPRAASSLSWRSSAAKSKKSIRSPDPGGARGIRRMEPDALESRRSGCWPGTPHRRGLDRGLLTNCVDLLGMLAGLQHQRPSANRPGSTNGVFKGKDWRVLSPPGGLVYFDAHADFNTPETTLSGMLGGMDVAAAAGLCLTRLRLKAGLDRHCPPVTSFSADSGMSTRSSRNFSTVPTANFFQ